MARKKVTKTGISEVHASATKETALALAGLINEFIEENNFQNPPSAYVTPTGIRPLDALLGGGFISSSPICFSSTPETGKSSIAYQMAKEFLDRHEAGIAVYCDVESISDVEQYETPTTDDYTTYHESRAETFGLDGDPRFIYCRRPFTIKDFFSYIDGLIQKKRQLQEQTGSEVKMLIILDSIASLSYSRLESVEEFDKIPGKRAAELSFYLTKLKQNFAFDRISMIVIDQLKANMSLKGLYEKPDEKSVGSFNNTRSATGIYTFQHAINQWLYFSKGSDINPGKYPGWSIDGWIINVLTEKNKCASSKNQISVIFDKRSGISKFWSEFYFLSVYSPSEVKLQRDGCKPFMDLCCSTSGAYTVLTVTNPITGEMEYESKKFYKKNAKELYDSDPEFHKWFDIAVDYSCKERISKGLLKINSSKFNDPADPAPEYQEVLEETNIQEEPVKKRGRKKEDSIIDEPIFVDDTNVVSDNSDDALF